MADPDPPDLLITALQSRDWAAHFAARQKLVALAGEAAEPLSRLAADESHPLRSVALELLTYIEQETSLRFSGRLAEILCPRCLTRFCAHSVHLPWGVSFTYYGCRVCSQSREFLAGIKRVVAILDAARPETQLRQAGILRVNWLAHPVLFDFDRVELIRTTDHDAERFAIQVGNDTDPYRKPRYSQMTCRIGPDCQLSENTLRILDRMFGEVERIQS
ncbi:MAG: hypothetical protein HC875_30270 [Anaerolineales bacterium]|nr:hypothetical protein [Anaerolineales bacterium]